MLQLSLSRRHVLPGLVPRDASEGLAPLQGNSWVPGLRRPAPGMTRGGCRARFIWRVGTTRRAPAPRTAGKYRPIQARLCDQAASHSPVSGSIAPDLVHPAATRTPTSARAAATPDI